MNPLHALLLIGLLGVDPLGPGNHSRELTVDGRQRSYLVHIPPQYDPQAATPVVLVLHGAGTNATITTHFTGMSKKSDQAGFLAVYLNGTGLGPFQTFNAGGWKGIVAEYEADDVAYAAKVLDDLATVVNCDTKRIFATGMSNGGMMCYRLAAELSDRIAAIAPVAGTMCIDEINLKRPLSVMHFHGKDDHIVPFEGPAENAKKFIKFKSVDDTMVTWTKANGCPAMSIDADEPDKADDGTRVLRKTYAPGKDGTEVILFIIEGGGHTWPGQDMRLRYLGKCTQDISANDLMWEFFQRHPLK
jgi:polyhydroxybutyrate depolymerase